MDLCLQEPAGGWGVAGQVGLLGRTLLSEDKKDPRAQGSGEGLKGS